MDVDGDARPDVYVANDTDDNFLYMNRGKGGALALEERGLFAGVARDDRGIANGSMGLDASDFDRTGRASLFVTNYENELPALYRNLTDGRTPRFVFDTLGNGVGAVGGSYVSWGTGYFDHDVDGWEDILVVSGHAIRFPTKIDRRKRPVLLRNVGGKFRAAATAGWPYLGGPHNARGAAFGDLDNDGRVVVVVSHLNEPVAVLRNVTPPAGRHWVGLRLVGEKGADVVGARVVLETAGGRQTRFAKGGGSYGSTNDPRLHFGLGGWRGRTRSAAAVAGARAGLTRRRRPARIPNTPSRRSGPEFASPTSARPALRRRIVLAVVALGLVALAGWQSWVHLGAWNDLKEGRAALARDDATAARPALDRCLETWPNHAEAHFHAAQAARKSGDPAAAARYLDAADRCVHLVAEVRFEQAVLKAQTGRPGEAADHLYQAVADGHPRSAEALEILVPWCVADFRIPEGGDLTARWVVAAPSAVPAWTFRAEVLERLGQKQEAVESLRRLAELDPPNRRARLSLARLLLKTRQEPGEAAGHLEWLTSTDPVDTAALVQLGACREAQGGWTRPSPSSTASSPGPWTTWRCTTGAGWS